MIIIISGMPGAGKSTATKNIAKRLKYSHISTGDIQRQLAAERKLTITEWGEEEKKDPKYDRLVDDKVKEMLSSNDNLVIDSWLAPHFAKRDAIKIFLECEENERARRRVHQKRVTESFDSLEKAKQDMRQRVETNRERWKRYYSYDFLDMANYDLIIDTTNLKPEQVAGKILEYVKDFS